MAFDAGSDAGLDEATLHLGVGVLGFSHTRTLLVGGRRRKVTYRAAAPFDLERRNAATRLLNDRYAWRGVGSCHSIPTSEHHTTFTTEIDGELVGTLTLAIDSDCGLAIDDSFGSQAAAARRPGVRICELVRFAFDGGVRSKEVLAGLFHTVFIYGTVISDCTDLFIEVHPRHATFYEGMLGFEAVGEAGLNASVRAPSQLMRLSVASIRTRIAELAGGGAQRSQHSLYPYFFSTGQERKIRAALQAPWPTGGGPRDVADERVERSARTARPESEVRAAA